MERHFGDVGRRASCVQRSMNVRPCGAHTSANAGTSSARCGKNPPRCKSKVSWATLIVPGSVGPKPRPKGVGDGQLVHIPVPPRVRYTNGRTEEGRPTGRSDVSGQSRREPGLENPSGR